MICAACGTENRAGRKFCSECAAPLAVVCPACGAANEPSEKFCGECATPLPGTAPPAIATAPATSRVTGPARVAERRLVSVLFADLVGFTAYAADRDPEEVRETLTRYFDLATDVIGRYGGTVEKFIGDAVMAVWGAPTAHEDDAERAVRAALELCGSVGALGPAIEARAGILTGEAAVTIGATNQGLVAGDLVNTASRLQSVAPPGAVLVGEATQRAAGRAVAFEAAGEQLLKGKAAPVQAWRAVRIVAQVGGRNRADTLEAPFVGRDDELRLLKDLFHATSREGRARLVSVIGPAGIGKSRLAWEFLKYLDGLVERVWYHDGRSPAYGEGVSFWALGEMIRARAGLAEGDDEPTSRARIAEIVARHVTDEPERQWIEPALLTLLGVEASADAAQLFSAWRTFFERLAETAPVVLVFEDFHHADDGLLDFVDHLMEWSRNAPIYVLTLARPELLERRNGWGAGHRSFTSLYLDPLPPAAMTQLLEGLVPGLPVTARQAIVARADGFPLYAIETVRMLLAEGRLEAIDGIYRPKGDLGSLEVPETLTALIASRLDALPVDQQALVDDAAVLGQSFTPAALTALSGLPADAVEVGLQALVRRELMVRQADARSPERGQYAFVQALIREVAYGTLSRADRKARHLAAARYCEALETDELAGALAGHYLAAHQNATPGPEAEALAVQARLALRGAGDRAATLGSPDQAMRFYEQALAVAEVDQDRAQLLGLIGGSAEAAGHHDRAIAALEAALETTRRGTDRLAMAAATATLAQCLAGGRELERTIALARPAAAEFADLWPDPVVLAVGAQLGRAYMLGGQNHEAIAAIDPVLEAAEHLDEPAILADALVTKGTALGALGRFHEGLAVMGAARALATEQGLTQPLLRAMNNSTGILWMFDPGGAERMAAEGLELSRRLGERHWLFSFMTASAMGRAARGDLAGSRALSDEGLTLEPEASSRVTILYAAVIVRVIGGEPVGEMVAELLAMAGRFDDPNVTWTFAGVPADVAFFQGRIAEAAGHWESGAERLADNRSEWLLRAAGARLRVGDVNAARADLARVEAEALRTPYLLLQRQAIQAALAAVEGRKAEALRGFREALRRMEERDEVMDRAVSVILMASVLDPAEPEVAATIAATRNTLERCGAAALLRQLDEVAGRTVLPPAAGKGAESAPSSLPVA